MKGKKAEGTEGTEGTERTASEKRKNWTEPRMARMGTNHLANDRRGQLALCSWDDTRFREIRDVDWGVAATLFFVIFAFSAVDSSLQSREIVVQEKGEGSRSGDLSVMSSGTVWRPATTCVANRGCRYGHSGGVVLPVSRCTGHWASIRAKVVRMRAASSASFSGWVSARLLSSPTSSARL